ncbi:ATP-binding protein [Actinomadura miaoliensis]|uniref:Histidine kinase/HSP90-like ATPase domain-containing protein n=1 Tax=Actinomadura miaoliensis TaxID=430685 RepID=A0ABP7WQY3_9ACTN
MTGTTHPLQNGGTHAWQLPANAAFAGMARSLLTSTLVSSGLPGDLVDAAALAVSELATNAYIHAAYGGSPQSGMTMEVWTHARMCPKPQLVVSVFDACRRWKNGRKDSDAFEEHGNGLTIVSAVTEGWDVHLTRARLAPSPTPGKAVHCALALPSNWLRPYAADVTPAQATRRLASFLTARDIPLDLNGGLNGVYLLRVPPDLNVWIEPQAVAFKPGDADRIRRPFFDLESVTEAVLHYHEQHTAARAPGPR